VEVLERSGTNFGKLAVSGMIAGGGEIRVEMSARGQLSFDPSAMSMDFGPQILGEMVKEAIARYALTLTGDVPAISAPRLDKRGGGDAPYEFLISAGADSYRVKIAPDGILANEGIVKEAKS